MIKIDHLSYKMSNIGMLIPFGEYKNAKLFEANVGDKVYTIDAIPVVYEIVSKAEISTKSQMAESLARMLYNNSIDFVMQTAFNNWGCDVYDDRVLFIVLKR